MRRYISIAKRWAFIMFTFLASGCAKENLVATGTGKSHPAVLTAFLDVSVSTAAIGDPAYGDRAADLVGRDFSRFHLGDTARVIVVGDPSAEHAGSATLISSGYSQRLPKAQAQLVATLKETFATYRRQGGDTSTNLLFALQNSHVTCTPGSRVVLITDGVEASANYSVGRALNNGKPVALPGPDGPYLRGCSVAIYGLGMTIVGGEGTPQALPNRQMSALEAGWRDYLRKAGVSSSDITFTSIL